MTLTFCKTPERASTILRLYFFSFLYYAAWGLISLQMEPIADDIDPGIRQIVFWHIHFNNRDGFGPLMVMGLAFSFYFHGVAKSRFIKLLAVASVLLCIMGILTSFGRGVFLASIATILYMLYKAKHKLLGIVSLVAAAVALVHLAPNFTDRYLSRMSTIFSEGTASGTGLDRKTLWGWAWREFLGSPIFGVGTGNFGIALQRVARIDEMAAIGYTPGRLWGRALHCAPMTVLCEYGIVGAITIARLLTDFTRSNRRIHYNFYHLNTYGGQDAARGNLFSDPSAMIAISNALSALFIAVLISSIFYELLYTPLLWHIIIINYLVYLISRDAARNSESGGN